MKNDDKRALVPRLRFPEFIGDTVREVQLKDVTAESTTRNGETLPPTSVMGVTKTEGIVPMEERIIALDIARYKLVQKDWFAYNPMRLNIGSIARWQGESDILVSPDYVVFKCLDEAGSGIDPAFLDHFRRSDAWEGFVTQGGDGSVRVRIYYRDIGRLPLTLPSIVEQQKIADCLTSLDELIAAQGRKVEALKAHKKGLMQQLFPREGETLPRLRFPEFQNAPEWEDEKLGKYVDIWSGGSPSQFVLSSIGRYPFVKVEDLNNCVKYQVRGREYCDDAEGVVPQQSVVFPKRGAAIELNKIRVTGTEILIDTNLMAITPKDELTTEFLFYYISNVGLAHIADTSTIPQINNKHIIPFAFLLPSVAEQQRIADCVSALDSRIVAETEKLSALKTHKRGLMQQLFPSPEGMA
jgi:type I restriction enzyme, S subunit